MATLTGLDKKKEQAMQALLLSRIATRYERAIANEIAKTIRLMAKSNADVGRHFFNHSVRMNFILSKLYQDAGAILGIRVYRQLNASLKDANTPGLITALVEEFILQHTAKKILSVATATRSFVINATRQGIEAGEGEKEIAKKIIANAPVIAASRAQTIARTESHSVANEISHRVAQESGVLMQREWVPASGPRTRKTHRNPDKKVVAMDEPFIIGGYRLMNPGDPRGPAKEVINCRCGVAYIVQE